MFSHKSEEDLRSENNEFEVINQILAVEALRCDAVNRGDVEQLRRLLLSNYIHIHADGSIDDLDGHVDAVGQRPRKCERRDLIVHVFGDSAVIVGAQINTMKDKVMTGIVQQTVVCIEGMWKFASFQMTLKK